MLCLPETGIPFRPQGPVHLNNMPSQIIFEIDYKLDNLLYFVAYCKHWTGPCDLGRRAGFRFLSYQRAAKAWLRLCKCAVSSELLLLAFTKYGSRGRHSLNFRHLVPLDSCVSACIKVTTHSNNRNSKSSREVILGSVRL